MEILINFFFRKSVSFKQGIPRGVATPCIRSLKKIKIYQKDEAKGLFLNERGLLNGAGEENRTLVSTLARSRTTIEPRPQNLYIFIITNFYNFANIPVN